MDTRAPTPPWATKLWRVGGSLAAVGLLGMGSVQAVSQLAHEEETIVRQLDGAGLRLVDVSNSAGGVQIVGTEGDEVTVRARVSHGLRSTGHSERIVGDRLVLEASCPVFASDFCEVTYRVEVPEDVAVQIRAQGRITVADVAGDVEASTDNGRVQASRVGGDVHLTSDNGRVIGTGLHARTAEAYSDNGRVELGFLDPPHQVTAASDNGSVEVVLPDTVAEYDVDVSSNNGTTATPINTDPESERTVTATSDNGDVTVRYSSGG